MKVKLDDNVVPTRERQHLGEGVLPGAHMPGESFDVEREDGERLVASDLPVVAARAPSRPSAPTGEETTSPDPVDPATAAPAAEEG